MSATTEVDSRSGTARVDVVVTGAGDLTIRGKTFRPTRLAIRYTFVNDAPVWSAFWTVYASRILKSGRVGESGTTIYASQFDPVPAWITDSVEANRPVGDLW